MDENYTGISFSNVIVNASVSKGGLLLINVLIKARDFAKEARKRSKESQEP